MFALPLVHEIAGENDRALLDVAVAGEVNLVGDPVLAAADAAREAGNAPNTIMAVAASIIGPKGSNGRWPAPKRLIELFAYSGLGDARDERFDLRPVRSATGPRPLSSRPRGIRTFGPSHAQGRSRARRTSLFLKFIESFGGARPSGCHPRRDRNHDRLGPVDAQAHLAAHRRTLPWYLRLYGVMIGATIPGAHHQRGSLCGIPREERFETWTMADLAFLALTGKKPSEAEARPFKSSSGF